MKKKTKKNSIDGSMHTPDSRLTKLLDRAEINITEVLTKKPRKHNGKDNIQPATDKKTDSGDRNAQQK